MAGKPDGGLKDALQLDQAAKDLVEARGEAAENPGSGDRIQHELFEGSSVFGDLKLADGRKVRPGGPGRPRGPSRVTRDLVKLIEQTGRHPIIAMAEIVATPIDVIAKTLGCKKIEAAEYHRKVMSDLAPYVAQKLPTAVQVQGANAGMLVINLGGPVGEGGAGLDMKLIEGEAQHQQNQELSDEDDEASHDAPSHGRGK